MGQDVLAAMLVAIRKSIAHIEASLAGHEEERSLTRALAHLWQAHDEIELMAAAHSRGRQPPRT